MKLFSGNFEYFNFWVVKRWIFFSFDSSVERSKLRITRVLSSVCSLNLLNNMYIVVNTQNPSLRFHDCTKYIYTRICIYTSTIIHNIYNNQLLLWCPVLTCEYPHFCLWFSVSPSIIPPACNYYTRTRLDSQKCIKKPNFHSFSWFDRFDWTTKFFTKLFF